MPTSPTADGDGHQRHVLRRLRRSGTCCSRNSRNVEEEAAGERKHRQHHQRRQHRRAAIRADVHGPRYSPKKVMKNGAQDVERGHAGGDHADPVHPRRVMRRRRRRIASLLKKPEVKGNAGNGQRRAEPASRRSMGIFFAGRPCGACPARRGSAWITLPAPRNSSALKNACVIRCQMPAENAPTPTPRNM